MSDPVLAGILILIAFALVWWWGFVVGRCHPGARLLRVFDTAMVAWRIGGTRDASYGLLVTADQRAAMWELDKACREAKMAEEAERDRRS